MPAEQQGETRREVATRVVGTVFDNTAASHETLKRTMIERIEAALKDRELEAASCRAVWVCKRCGNCARHCKHNDPANFYEDLDLPCSGPCQCIDCIPRPVVTRTEVFTIKPLEWEWFNNSYERGYKAHVPFLAYDILVYQKFDDDIKEWLTPWFVSFDSQSLAGYLTSPEEGKQLAEQHWREYVKQALVPMGDKLMEMKMNRDE